MKRTRRLDVAAFLAGTITCSMVAVGAGQTVQSPASSPSITRDQADTIVNELKQIRALLEKLQAPVPAAPAARQPAAVRLQMNDAPSIGSEGAPLTLVEFADYQCPFCRQFHSATFDQLKKAFIDTGQVRFISRDLPLDIHGNALKAAQAARCAGEQGRFWEMRDILSRNAGNLGPDAIVGYASGLGLDAGTFSSCASGDKYLAEIRHDVAEAAALGISGTPSFVLGTTVGRVLTGTLIVGAQPFATFEASVKGLQSKTQ